MDHVCVECGASFGTPQALSGHKWGRHKSYSEVRRYTYATHCAVCLKEFHTSHRMHVHLRYSATCLKFCQQNLPPLCEADFINVSLGEQYRGHRRIPYVRLQGPFLGSVEEWQDSNLIGPREDTCGNEAPGLPSVVPYKKKVAPKPTEADEHVLVLDRLYEADCQAHFGFRQACVNASTVALTLVGGRRTYYVLDLFAGPGNFRQHVEELCQALPFDICVLPVNFAHGHKLGDLGSPKTVDCLIRLCKQGLVLAVKGRPPCKTWRSAQSAKPFRSSRQPWSIPPLRHKEYCHLRTDSVLLQACVAIMLATYASGGAFLLEHLGEPKNLHSASIWKLPQINWVRALPNVVFDNIWLREGGHVSSRGLLLGNVPHWCKIRDVRIDKLGACPSTLCYAFAECCREVALVVDGRQQGSQAPDPAAVRLLGEYRSLCLSEETGHDFDPN